jgi:tetratricopeptide (TPR) repeat protein
VWEYHEYGDDWLGVAPEKLAAIREIEQAGLMPAGAATEYALRSRRRGRRNSLIRRTALAGICTLTVLAGIAAWLALKQRDVARTEAATSDRTTQFMVGLFQLADPDENRGNAITVKEVLDKGAREIQSAAGSKGLEQDPRVRAELLTAMGQAYTGLGLYKPAEALLTQAQNDVQSPSVSDETRVRTLVANGSTLNADGDYDNAAKSLESAVALARKTLAPSNPLRSSALTELADLLIQLEKYPEAEQLCKEALVADRKRGPEGAEILAKTLQSLGLAYFHSDDFADAEVRWREVLAIREKNFGMHHALTALALHNLGYLFYQSGRYEDAVAMYRQALPIYREVYGDEHPEVATILNNIGRAALIMGQVDEAEPLLRQTLAMTLKFEGETHADLVSPLNSLAMIDAYRGKLDAAMAEIRRADTIARLPDHGELLDQVLTNEADMELAHGNREKASALLLEAEMLLQKAYRQIAPNAWRYAVWNAVNAQLLAANGDFLGAERALAAAQAIIVKRFGPNGFYSLLAKRRALLITQYAKG